MENNNQIKHPTHKGLSKTSGEWVYGYYLRCNGDDYIAITCEEGLGLRIVKEGTVCRYLPEFDMYVGDVVQHPDFNNPFILIDYGYKFVFKDNGTMLEYSVDMFYNVKDKLKVIGDIFEDNKKEKKIMNKIELAVGTEIKFGGKPVTVIENCNLGCEESVFYGMDCLKIECSSRHRTDGKDVIFKVKKDYSDYHQIKTYEDACEALGEEPVDFEKMNGLLVENDFDPLLVHEIAYKKLITIAKALNNDPDFPRYTSNEYCYCPWFYLYTKEEIDRMDEDKRKSITRRLLRSYGSSGAGGGVAYAYAYDALSSSYTGVGSRLILKSRELAKYLGTQFIELWRDFLIGE